MPSLPAFATLAQTPGVTLDRLALGLAAEFRETDADSALRALDDLGAQLGEAIARTDRTPQAQTLACTQTLGGALGFTGDDQHYDDPRNSMLDVVLSRRQGLPILLSVVYIEVSRRAGVPIEGVGLPGHFVVGHFGTEPPILLDPFAGGTQLSTAVDPSMTQPWPPHDIAMRMLNNLLAAYTRRQNLTAAIRAATLRLALPTTELHRQALTAELRTIQARLN